jgi:hypothetical protein
VAGGGHSCDPRWLAQEWVDDAETWGKTTARTQGLARHEESPNGKASRWLADSEGAAAVYLGVGEKQWNGGSFGRSVAFIPQRRERGVRGPACQRRRPTTGRSDGNAAW